MNHFSGGTQSPLKKYILLICVIVSSLAVAMGGVLLSSGKGNPIEAFMLFVRDGFETDTEDSEEIGDSSETEDERSDGSTGKETANPDDTDESADNTGDTEEASNPVEPPETETPSPEEYFTDVLFIGDSRTVGLYTYGRIEGASYFARTSMNVSNCFADKKSETGTGKLNLEEYLTQNKFGKIYILLGINEIGYSYNWIVTRYEKILTRLRELQPDAVIIIQSNMHVTKAKSDANPESFNNKRIDELNKRLSLLADGKKIFYLGFESIFDDANGNLRTDYTGDGVHLKAKCYKYWRDYILENGRIKVPAETGGSASVTKPVTTDPVKTTPPKETAAPEETTPPEKETTDPEETTVPEDTIPPVTMDGGTSAPEDEDYFEDALFIGDSRTVGFYTYGRIEGASYFARTSMNVKNCFADKKSETGTGTLNLEDYLSQNKFGKIYILLGINEIGYSYAWIVSNYTAVVEKIHALQPDAKIIIQSNMHVTKAKSDANPDTFNNVRIDELNKRLSALADNEYIFYLGFESIFDDENGNLKTDYSRDGIHFKADTYKIWRDWLIQNGKI